MKVFEDTAEWRQYRKGLSPGSLGFVPTMGALHAGHRALMEASVADNTVTVASVFVNPTQFDQASDLDAYPRQSGRDLDALRSWGADAVLMPGFDDLYPDDYRYKVSENDLSRRFCGAHRAGHFDGVLTVVMRLLNLVRPDRAYFGEKDYQQLLLVRGMAEAFFLDVEIVGCPTVREGDGLALSSRNQRLDPAQRSVAPALYRSLREAPDAEAARISLEQNGFEVDYVEDFGHRRLAAARLGEVRLIDNVSLEDAGHD